MAWDGYFRLGEDTEISNVARTVGYAQNMGLEQVWRNGDFSWMNTYFNIYGYKNPTNDETAPGYSPAPWFDPNLPASADFGGMMILSAEGLEDSTRSAETIEFTGDGGRNGKLRNGTKTIVFSAALVGKTEESVEYGLRWLKSVLKRRDCTGLSTFCNGQDLYYFRSRWQGGPMSVDDKDLWRVANEVHLRDVTFTRGPTVTRKRVGACDVVWTISFTAVAADPYEYGFPLDIFQGLGAFENIWYEYLPPFNPIVGTDGVVYVEEEQCPVPIWDPIYDPMFPTLQNPPGPPDYYPDGWYISPGTWERYWADLPDNLLPLNTDVVPILTIGSVGEARMVRVRFYNIDEVPDPETVCTPFWETIISYIPDNFTYIIDATQRASYTLSTGVPRRTDALVYGPEAKPMTWPVLSCNMNLRVTVEQAISSDEMANLSLSLTFIPRNE